jgi:subtilase family serine protease
MTSATLGPRVFGLQLPMRFVAAFGLTALLLNGSNAAFAQTPESLNAIKPVPARVLSAVDDRQRLALSGHVRPFLAKASDLGAVDDSVETAPIMLMLSRTPQQQAELDSLVDTLHNKKSPSYQHWLTPQQFGARFQPADSDVAAVKSWLQSEGLTVLDVSPSKTFISFTGTVRQLRTAFGVEVHKFSMNGENHMATVTEPNIPVALASVIGSINKLDDFSPKPLVKNVGVQTKDIRNGKTKLKSRSTVNPQFTFTDTSNDVYYAVGPQDFYTIYNENALLNATSPINGAGQTIAVIEEQQVAAADVTSFRSFFGLPAYPATPNATAGGVNYLYGNSASGLGGYASCYAPATVAAGKTSEEEGEADLDLQWSGAVAPNAIVDFVACGGTATSPDGSQVGALGIDHSAQYIANYLSSTVVAASMSYGECEADLTTTNLAYYTGQWEQFAAEGITAIVSSGDGGAEQCYQNKADATTLPPSVNGFGSSAYNVSAGGTDFGDAYESFNYANTPSTTWWNATNGTGQSSAVGYVTETAWGGNCSNPLFASLLQADAATVFGTVYTTWDICSKSTGSYSAYLAVAGGAGGISTYSAIPTWQSVYGVGLNSVSTTKRNLPDVSLFAASGFWGHLLPYCESDEGACTLAGYQGDANIAGGTSFVAPQLAGMMALITQKTGMRQGQADYTLYNLAQQEYGTTTTAASSLPGCSSTALSTGGRPASTCIFYDISNDAPSLQGGTITAGNQQPCLAKDLDCYNGNQSTTTYKYGVDVVPGTSTTSANPAFGYTVSPGYDAVTGLGSINIAGLVNNWSTVTPLYASTTALTTSSASVTVATNLTLTAAVTATGRGGTVAPGGSVQFYIGSTAGTLLGTGAVSSVCTGTGAATSCTGTASISVLGSTLNYGPNSIIAYFMGDGANDAPSSSTAQTVNLPATGTTSQSIAFSPASSVLNGTTGTLPGTATSSLAINYSVVSGPATITGSTVLYTGNGTVVITANQYGNATYAAATQVQQSVVVSGDFVWVVGATGTRDRVYQAADVALQGVGTAGTISTVGGVAVDGTNNIWSVTTGSNTLYFNNNLGTTTGSIGGGGLSGPASVAIDGAGYVWVANSTGNTLSEFTNAGVAVTSTSGYGSSYAPGSMLSAPASVVIDSTGGVWIANQTGNTVTHIVGAAAPVVTPVVTNVINGTIGTKP